MNTQAIDFERMLEDAYRKVGAFDADILYIYSDFRNMGIHAAAYKNKNEFCDAVVSPLLKKQKTIVMTSFTYTTEGRFDVLNTPTNLGILNKWILKQPGFGRSEHPLFSYAALGPEAKLVENIGKSAFGVDSVFDRLKLKKTGFLHIGRPVFMGNTALHHIEHICGATYRIHKAFNTEVFRENEYIGTDYTAFLRRRDVPGEDFDFDFKRAAEILNQKKLVSQVGSDHDLSNISFYWYDQTLDYMQDMFYKDQGIFINSNYIEY